MAARLGKIFNRERADIKDAKALYRTVMAQSRKPEFYGDGKIPDSYDGRIDFLTLHLSSIMGALNTHGENGKRLFQAVYDVMIDDFDVALREEGLSDTGVVRRIKPMANLFFARAKAYTDAFKGTDEVLQSAIQAGYKDTLDDAFAADLVGYVRALNQTLSELTLGHIAKADISFPKFKSSRV